MVRVQFPRQMCSEPSTISSIDIHPDGSRFVSAVNGDSVNPARLTFWNMEPVRNPPNCWPSPEEILDQQQQPWVLCEKEVPHVSINCVRWSGAGHLLASAEDEHVVVWCYSRTTAEDSSFGARVANVENWKPLHDMKGHRGNVFDLRWSPADRYLASCSVDNSIMIWNGKRLPELFRTLSGHSNLVKGLCWDPLGKFLASQSDDRTMRVWRTADWAEECMVFKPFTKEFTTHYLRCDWSPDAQMLVSSHAVNGEGPVAVICSRARKFVPRMDFVGHRRAITCVRFHPRMVRVKETNEVTCLLAIASKDRAVSFWLSSRPKAFLALHELLDDEVVDLSWATNSIELAACSITGKIKFVLFRDSEIGRLLTQHEQTTVLQRLHGEDMNETSAPSILVSDPDMFPYLVKEAELNEKENVSSSPEKPTPKKVFKHANMTSSAVISTTQKELISKDGRRRIVPVCIGLQQPDSNEDAVVMPVPFRGRQENLKRDDDTQENVQIREGNSSVVTSTTSPESSPISPEQRAQKQISVQDLKLGSFRSLQSDVKNKDQNTGSTTLAMESLDPAVHTTASEAQVLSSNVIRANVSPDSSTVAADKPSAVPDKGISAIYQAKSPLTDVDSSVKSAKMTKAKKLKQNALKMSNSKGATTLFQSQGAKKKKRRVILEDDDDESGLTASRMRPNEMYGSRMYGDGDASDIDAEDKDCSDDEVYSPVEVIDPAKVLDAFTVNHSHFEVTVTNNVSIGPMAPSMHMLNFKYSTNEETDKFTKCLTDPIVCACVSEELVVVACADDTVHVYDHNGNILEMPFVVDASIAQLKCKGHMVMVLTCEVTVSVFDMRRMKSVLWNYQLTNLFRAADVKLKLAFFSENGTPFIVTTAHKAYMFHAGFNGWVLAQPPRWSLAKRGTTSQTPAVGGSSGSSSSHTQTGVMSLLEDLCSDNRMKDNSLAEAVDRTRRNDPGTCSAVENMVHYSTWQYSDIQQKLAMNIASGPDVKKWLLGVISELSWIGNEDALRAKLDELLDNVGLPSVAACFMTSSQVESSRDPIERLGLNRRQLLHEALDIVAKNVKNQKIFSEYNQILKQL